MKQEQHYESFMVHNRFESVVLNFDDVLYVRKRLRKVYIFSKEGSHWEYTDIDDILHRMDARMCRCHRSLAINMNNVIRIKQNTLVMKDQTVLTLCKNYYYKVKKQIRHYWTKTLKEHSTGFPTG